MERNRVTTWLQLGGNLAVLVGLLFVGFQLYQDRELKRAELIFAGFDTTQNRMIALLGEDPQRALVKAATEPEQLTEEEAYVAGTYLFMALNNMNRSAVMEDLGVWGDGWRQDPRPVLPWEFGTELGRRVMEDALPDLLVPESVKEQLRQRMKERPDDLLRSTIEGWRGKYTED